MTEGRVPTEPDDSPLVDHAKHEMDRAGLYDDDADYNGMVAQAVQELVETLAAQRHSGFSAQITLTVFEKVARWDVLTPLTDNPTEWTDVSEVMGFHAWQSTRKPSAFSYDDGKTWVDIGTEEEGECQPCNQ